MNIQIYLLIFCLVFSSSTAYAKTEKGYSVVLDMQEICENLLVFYRDVGRLPSSHEGLHILIHNNNIFGWNGPYMKRIRDDAWGMRFQYYYPRKYGNERYDLYSYGKNRIDNLSYGDDMSNWRIFDKGTCAIKNH